MRKGNRKFTFELDHETKEFILPTICNEFEMTREQVIDSWKKDPTQMKRDWDYAMTNMA